MKKGFSLLEIVISLVILGLTLAGIFSVFIAGRRYTERARRKLVSLNIGRQVLEKIKEDVRQDTWDIAGSNRLTVGTHLVESGFITAPAGFDNWEGTISYEISNIANVLRQATITITWNEPSE